MLCASAWLPAAASTPAWRMPPPSILRQRRAARDEIAPAAEQRPDRRAQSLRQAHRHRVEAARDLARRHAPLHRGIPQSRAVEMQREAAPVGELAHRLRVAVGQHASADGVLQRDEPRAREVHVVRLDRRLDRGERQRAVAARCPAAAAARCPAPRRRRPRTCSVCASCPTMNSSPRAQCVITPMRFDCVPEGTYSAASKPSSAAVSASSALTLGSSPKTSSPTARRRHRRAHRRGGPGDGVGAEIGCHLRSPRQLRKWGQVQFREMGSGPISRPFRATSAFWSGNWT